MVTWLLPWLVADGSWRFQLMLGERRTLTVFRRVGRAAFANPLMLRERTHKGTVGTIGRLSERAGGFEPDCNGSGLGRPPQLEIVMLTCLLPRRVGQIDRRGNVAGCD